jgi:hypothetical protein
MTHKKVALVTLVFSLVASWSTLVWGGTTHGSASTCTAQEAQFERDRQALEHRVGAAIDRASDKVVKLEKTAAKDSGQEKARLEKKLVDIEVQLRGDRDRLARTASGVWNSTRRVVERDIRASDREVERAGTTAKKSALPRKGATNKQPASK